MGQRGGGAGARLGWEDMTGRADLRVEGWEPGATLGAKERLFQAGGAGQRLAALKGLGLFRRPRKDPEETDDVSKGGSGVNQRGSARLRQVPRWGVRSDFRGTSEPPGASSKTVLGFTVSHKNSCSFTPPSSTSSWSFTFFSSYSWFQIQILSHSGGAASVGTLRCPLCPQLQPKRGTEATQ